MGSEVRPVVASKWCFESEPSNVWKHSSNSLLKGLSDEWNRQKVLLCSTAWLKGAVDQQLRVWKAFHGWATSKLFVRTALAERDVWQVIVMVCCWKKSLYCRFNHSCRIWLSAWRKLCSVFKITQTFRSNSAEVSV